MTADQAATLQAAIGHQTTAAHQTRARREHEMRSGGPGRERGNAALELVVLAPVILFFLGLLIAAGRTSIAQGSVDAAARDAARQASISRSPAAAQSAALASARTALGQDALNCAPLVTVNVAGFAVPVGRPARSRPT